MEWDTSALISDTLERGSLPDNDARFTDAMVLAAATRELREGVAPILVASRAEHLVYAYEVAAVSGTAAYRMPPRAVGGALRDVVWVDSGGNPQPPLRQLSPDECEALARADGTPVAYFLRNYHVVLVPTPNAAGTLRMPYYARPNALVLPDECLVVRSVSYNATTGAVEILTLEPIAAFQTDPTVDVVRATPGFESLVTAQAVLTEDLGGAPDVWAFRYTSTTDPGIVARDYLCLAGQAPVPQAPVELHGLLAARTARRLLKAVGDGEWQALDADVQELTLTAQGLLNPRVAGDTQQAGGSMGSNGMVAGLGTFGYGWW